MKTCLSFDDALLVPGFSEIKSRKFVDVSTVLAGLSLEIPIISANMDTVTDVGMALAMKRLGGLGIMHRYASTSTILSWIDQFDDKREAIPSIGFDDFEKALCYADAGITTVCIDVAHGHHQRMTKLIPRLKDVGLNVIAGNVATFSGAMFLAALGADVIKVGIGPGSVCTTRVVTGHGVPQLTAIMDAAAVKNEYPNVGIIADGGIRSSGDGVKALAAGADALMLGGLLAGTDETPGNIRFIDNKKLKVYRGMASRRAQQDFRGYVSGTPEGEETFVDARGPVKDILVEFVAGLKSGLSYTGASNLQQLKEMAQWIQVTSAGYKEGLPHGLK